MCRNWLYTADTVDRSEVESQFKLIVGCLATIILGSFQRSLKCCESLTQTTYKNKINFSMFEIF